MPTKTGNCGKEAQIIEVGDNIVTVLGMSDASETVIRYISDECSYCDLLSKVCFPVVRWARNGLQSIAVISEEID